MPVSIPLVSCVLAVLLGMATLSACGPTTAPPAIVAPAGSPGRAVAAAPAEPAPTTDARTCPDLAIVLADVAAGLGLSGDVEASAGLYAYAEALPALYSLRLLLDRTGDGVESLDDPESDLSDIDTNVLRATTPGYRLAGTCGRIYVESYLGYATQPVEAFYTLDPVTRSLVLVDSLGASLGVLPLLGGRAASPERTVLGSATGRVTFDPAGPALVSASGRALLRDVLPYGTWYARPSGVQYQGSDLVVVHTCNPYPTESAGRCGTEAGFDMDNPPLPVLRTHVGVRLVGDRFELTPYADDGRPEFRETRILPATPPPDR